MTDLVLLPAACYPVYPWVASAGKLPSGGRLVDVLCYCFRHEPSADPARMQAFRQRENVCIGAAEDVAAWHQSWIDRGLELLDSDRALGNRRGGQRRVLRPQRQDARGEPARAGPQARARLPDQSRSQPDGDHVHQLPPGSLRLGLRHRHRPTGALPIPPALALGSSASRSRSCGRTGSNSTSGPTRSAAASVV